MEKAKSSQVNSSVSSSPQEQREGKEKKSNSAARSKRRCNNIATRGPKRRYATHPPTVPVRTRSGSV
jgi:hypothetical protein